MESSKTSEDARQADIIYFLNRQGRIEHPHLIRIHHLCHSALHLRDVKRFLSELRGKEMPDSFAWSYQRRYKKGLVWQDLMDDDLLTPIADSEYVLLGSLLPGADSKSDLFPSPEMKSSPESEEIDVEEGGVLPEKVGRSSPAGGGGGGGRRHPWKPAHVLRSIRTCGAVDTVDSTLFAGGRSGVYGGLTKRAGPTRSPLRLKNSREDDNKRESEAAGGGKSSRKAGRVHMPKPKCSQCGKPFNPEKLHSHMISCRGLKRSGK